MSRMGSIKARSCLMLSTTPSPSRGCRRRVPSKRRTSTSGDASRNSTRTRSPPLRNCSSESASSSTAPPPARPTTSATRSVSDPGRPTSSATLPMSAGGRLSMTNHPRSSNVSPAVDRPAPDSPAMMRNSPMSARHSHTSSAAIGALALAVAVPFALRGPGFILDDWFTLYFRRFQGVLWAGGHGQLAARPGAWLTYLLEFGLIGAHPQAIYAIQTLLNVAIAVALFRLARRFVPESTALAIAVVWVVLQDHSTVDHWASTTPSQVSLLLLLVGGLALVTATDRRSAGVLAVALFAASALSYEATLPVAAAALFAVP